MADQESNPTPDPATSPSQGGDRIAEPAGNPYLPDPAETDARDTGAVDTDAAEAVPVEPDPGSAETAGEKKPLNFVGLLALLLASLGLVLGLLPEFMPLGWALILGGFVTAFIGILQKNRENITPTITLGVSAVGLILSAVVMAITTLGSVEEALGSSTQSEAATSSGAASATAQYGERNREQEYQDALDKAHEYMEASLSSPKELYTVLTDEHAGNFSPEAAQYAIDHLDVDWNEVALEVAQRYLTYDHPSYAKLYYWLSSERVDNFTPEQAQYAVDHVEVDWNQEALEATRSYTSVEGSFMGNNKDLLYQRLTSEDDGSFTPEQAQYAIDNL